jgi:hypothetical protein
MSNEFPKFAGEVYKRPAHYEQKVGADAQLDDYTVHAYQYATSSRPGECQPAAIVYAANESDVRLAIQYAKDAGIAIAVRTGGHHFWGYSSTSGENLQLDMSNFDHYRFDSESGTATCGVAMKLRELDKHFCAMGAFVPHGQCALVCLGGHLQSGGFSVFCGRSFGWFCDHVTQFRIITADLETRVVHRPVADAPDKANDDLWFAAIGGSPGNFGVVTELTIKPLWDRDYPETRSVTHYMHYSPEAQEALLEIVADYNDRDDLPAEFNLMTFILGGYQPVLRPNIDTKMMHAHPEIYGKGLEPHPALIGIWATWCNLDGGPYSQEAKDFFADLEARTARVKSLFDHAALRVIGPLVNKVFPILSPEDPIPMSTLMAGYCFPKRVHANPYVSGTWCGQSQQLKTNGFARWAADLTAQVQRQNGCYADFEWVVCGGKHSRNKLNAATNPTAIAWRDLTLLCFQYVHYDNTSYLRQNWSEPKEFSLAWVERARAGAVGPNGIVAVDDRRWKAFPEQDTDLDKERAYYFQSEEVYQRVLSIKRELDPNDVFTPNLFCVGASRKYGTARKAEAVPSTTSVKATEAHSAGPVAGTVDSSSG